MIKIALIGNPNSGKTTLFNELTNSNQSVGNWPGVTVEKKSGIMQHQHFSAEIIDLPGIYSLSTISLEEEITATYIFNQKIDLLINIVDASNLERNLFLTYQLLDSEIPLIIVLNCMDIVESNLDFIHISELEESLGVKVIPVTASKKQGIKDLKEYISTYQGVSKRQPILYTTDVENVIDQIQQYTMNRFTSIRVFEDGLKCLKLMQTDVNDILPVEEILSKSSNVFDVDMDMVLPNQRYNKIQEVVDKVFVKGNKEGKTLTEKIDQVVTSRLLGLPIFAGIMFLMFFISFGPLGTFITDQFVALMEMFLSFLSNGILSLGMAPWVSSLVTNGIFGGLAAVVGFLPQLAILFLFLALLEDSGYMARAAFIMDRLLKRFGLSGKSFIPMLVGFGCSVPAMASTRTLDSDHDRKITTLIIPFISCGAKAPIYGVFAGALFFSNSYLVVFSMYLLGIIVAILSALLFKKTILKKANANYILELPLYRVPTLKNTLRHTWERSKGFLVKAGTVLLGAFILIWFFSYFGFVNGRFMLLDSSEIGNSILGIVGRFLLPIFRPIGFTDWEAVVAILTGFVAKESVVGSLGILYGIQGDVVSNGSLLYASIQQAFTPVQAYAFMAFALLSTPCIAAIAAMKRELNSWKWLSFALLYETIVAYLVALLIYQIGILDIGTILSILFGVLMVFIVLKTVIKIFKNKGSTCESCTNCQIKGTCHLPNKDKIV